jgi:ParB family chromosome partitioning protein
VQFGDAELAELADSIRSQGIIQPLIIRRTEDAYELVTGERRLRAAKIAGLKTVPVVLKDLSDAEMLEMSIVENIQRENFNPIEEAEAYYRLINEFKLTQEEAAIRVGKSRSAVANFLRLRQLSADIKTSIIDGQVSMGHARALLGAANRGQQRSAWRQIIAKNLSVRQTEALIKRLKSQPQASPAKTKPIDPVLADIETDLSRMYGTRVKIRRKGGKGTVSIQFYSDDDLNRLLDQLRNSP